ncbi:sigma-70 family RNA polymerase sigma factor [Jiangella alkaliphila]|uniref:sigma-70 family RNA polymerase sigma factor n=1 Tax=Jiangella alkaliphila TaxID=419479 RepID=UPI000699D517|nr:sigma-70 family RNA polymerase sigma factor [Jiangella alkaliphila]
MTLTAADQASRTRALVTRSVVALRRQQEGTFDVVSAYDDHGRELYAFALHALGDRAQAEECVQDTFVRAWRARTTYRPDRATVRTWLFAIARNLVIDTLRARQRWPRPVDSTRAEDRADNVRASLDRLLVAEALTRLSDEHRQVIVQVQLNGVSYEELSRVTHVPVATLRTRMYYGLRSLRTALKEVGEIHA